MDASPSICFQQPQPSSLAAHVVSVVAQGSDLVVWNFDTNVDSVDAGGPPGFNIDGDDPISALIIGARAVEMGYPGIVNGGETWTVDPGYSGINFAGGALLTPASGLTTT